MRAFILGCSHAAGSEMWHEPGFPISDVVLREAYGYTHSYAAKIAQALGYEIHNHAIPGGSNDAMYRIFCELDISSLDIVIACWTGSSRTEVWCQKHSQWIEISGGIAITNKKQAHPTALQGMRQGSHVTDAGQFENYAKQWTILQSSVPDPSVNKIKNIEALNCRAQNQKITVLNFHSFEPVRIQCGSIWPSTDAFCDWAVSTNQYQKSQGGHWFESAHNDYAQLALKNIDKKIFCK